MLIPAALGGQVNAENVRKISKRVKIVAEGANGPTTPEADEVFQAEQHLRHPGFPVQCRRRDLLVLRKRPERHELLLDEEGSAGKTRSRR